MTDKSKQLRTYAIQFPVTIEQPSQAEDTKIRGFIYLSFNLDFTYYSCQTLRNALGLYPGSYVEDDTFATTAIKFGNASDLCRLGALGQLNVTLKPLVAGQTYANLGNSHRTSFYFTLDKSIQAVAQELKAAKITIAESTIEYVVVPSSISLRKSKKTTPHF